jgi:cysteinyl-tRNA synthetase
MLRLHDTALGEVVDAVPEPSEHRVVSMYVCGPTVYDVPHLGHGRFALVFDVLRRYLEWKGHEVHYVSNITDIDDKVIARAAEEGRPWEEVARTYEAIWWQAMDALGVRRPSEDPHATAYVERMVALVEELVGRGVAYETSDGVYFAVEKVDGYGLLARQSLDSLLAGARVDVREEKRSPADFALWKKAKPGEPSWPSPWGPGRPGWHTECVVMSVDLLGPAFDIHGGGADLAFPHHENERAQAVAMGWPFARRWVHNGFVEVGGHKMSKSAGNFTTLTDLLASTDPRAYRLLVLRSHYRSPLEVTPGTTADASAALARLDEFARHFAARAAGVAPDDGALARFRALMDDDLATPAAMALLFELVGRANRDGDLAAAAAALEICSAVGLDLRAGAAEVVEEVLPGRVIVVHGEAPPDVVDRVRRREEARAARDWATADALRAELAAAGWVVRDTPQGAELIRADR